MPENADDFGLMSEDMIAKSLEASRARIARAERERADLDRMIAAEREEERLLERLLALRRGGTVAVNGGATHEEQQRLKSGAGGDASKHPAVHAVMEELAATGRPVHISELMRLLQHRKVTIPGAGTQANLITHLRRDARLVRPSRGMYGLAAWGLENMPTPGRRRRRKRMRSTAVDGRSHG